MVHLTRESSNSCIEVLMDWQRQLSDGDAHVKN
jgi:hypothetical protein